MIGNYYYKRKVAYTYNITTQPLVKAVDMPIVSQFLKLNDLDDDEETLLNMLIDSATQMAELYTGRDFVNKGYTTYRDNFCDMLIRRSKVVSIDSIQYLLNGVWTTVDPSVYAVQDVNDYPYIYLQQNQSWPSQVDCITQAVKIMFTSGYGDCTGSNIPAALKTGLLMHINSMYNNRADCGCNPLATIPADARALYDMYRILKIGTNQRPPLRIY